MRKLIFNADDFGLSPGINEGIVEAHTKGVVTSSSLMVLAGAAAEAAVLGREHASLSVGLHLVDDSPGLDDPARAAHVFAAQLERFRELMGGDPTHVDSHHHVHATRGRLPTFARLVAPLGVPLRLDGGIRYIGAFYGQSSRGVSNPEFVSRGFLAHLIATDVFDGTTEIGCHPARMRLDFTSSYVKEREIELRTLTAPGLRPQLESGGVTLVSHRDWRCEVN